MPAEKKRAAKSRELRPLHLLEDEPVRHFGDDGLGLLDFAQVIAGAAVGTTGPFTIGVFAGWGQGKTSVLRQARSLIDEDPAHRDVVTAWFNAWQFEKEEHPIVPLVGTILRAIEARKSGFSDRAKRWFSSAVKALRAVPYGISIKGEVGVPGLAKTTVGVDGAKMLEREEELTEKEKGAWEEGLYFQAFDALEKLGYPEDQKPKGKKGPPAKPKVVVFIDDLDRCLPDQGLKLLESLKLVLAQPGFIFVLAVDRRTIEGYLTKRYRDDFGVADYETSGTSYLDKIVQLPLGLPSHGGRFEDYIEHLLEKPALTDPSNEGVRRALTGLREVLAAGSRDNPRSLVRLINNLIVDQTIWVGERDPDLLGLCAVSRILSERLGGLYRSLVNDSDLCEQIATGGARLEAMLVDLEAKKGKRLGLREERRRAVVDRLARAGLEAVIQTAAGQRWLTRHAERIEFDQFLVSGEEVLEPEAQKKIIEEEIRASLGMGPEDPISDQDKFRVDFLSLVDRSLGDDGLQALQGVEGLQELHLSGNRITGTGLQALQSLPNLAGIYLDRNPITDQGVATLEGLSQLRSVSLEKTRITRAGIERLAALSKLSWLNLGDNRLGDEDLEPLLKLTKLESLHIHNNQITDGGVEKLEGLEDLRELSLGGNRITRRGVELLAGFPKLTFLAIDQNGLSDADLEPLSRFPALEALFLQENRLTDAVFATVGELKGLRSLGLGGNQITGSSLEELTRFSDLEWLDLGRLELQDADLAPLERLSNLVVLFLNGNKITGDGLKPLRTLKSLAHLALDGNPIDDAGLEHLRELKNLVRLYLVDTKVTQTGWNELKESIPGLGGSYGRKADFKQD